MGKMGLEPPKDCGVVLSYFNLLQTTISETGSLLTLWLNNQWGSDCIFCSAVLSEVKERTESSWSGPRYHYKGAKSVPIKKPVNCDLSYNLCAGTPSVIFIGDRLISR